MRKNNDKNNICFNIWKECEPQIRKLCSVRLGDFSNEEDKIISDIYSELCAALKDDRINTENCKSWIYSTANTKICEKSIQICEKIHNERAFSTDYMLKYEYNYVDDIINDENIEIIKKEIESELNESDLLLIKLKYEDNLEYSEIAEQLNLTEFEIKQQIYKLFQKIKMSAHEKINKLL